MSLQGQRNFRNIPCDPAGAADPHCRGGAAGGVSHWPQAGDPPCSLPWGLRPGRLGCLRFDSSPRGHGQGPSCPQRVLLVLLVHCRWAHTQHRPRPQPRAVWPPLPTRLPRVALKQPALTWDLQGGLSQQGHFKQHLSPMGERLNRKPLPPGNRPSVAQTHSQASSAN